MGCSSSKVGIIQTENTTGRNKVIAIELEAYSPDKVPEKLDPIEALDDVNHKGVNDDAIAKMMPSFKEDPKSYDFVKETLTGKDNPLLQGSSLNDFLNENGDNQTKKNKSSPKLPSQLRKNSPESKRESHTVKPQNYSPSQINHLRSLMSVKVGKGHDKTRVSPVGDRIGLLSPDNNRNLNNSPNILQKFQTKRNIMRLTCLEGILSKNDSNANVSMGPSSYQQNTNLNSNLTEKKNEASISILPSGEISHLVDFDQQPNLYRGQALNIPKEVSPAPASKNKKKVKDMTCLKISLQQLVKIEEEELYANDSSKYDKVPEVRQRMVISSNDVGNYNIFSSRSDIHGSENSIKGESNNNYGQSQQKDRELDHLKSPQITFSHQIKIRGGDENSIKLQKNESNENEVVMLNVPVKDLLPKSILLSQSSSSSLFEGIKNPSKSSISE